MPHIPAEILHEIFKRSSSSPLKAHQAGEFPWYLGHVCSQWRALFFSMRSTFWSKIEIQIWTQSYYDSIIREEYFEDMEEIVLFFLDCTRGAPFSFRFCMDGYRPKDTSGVCLILMDLIDHSVQWEEVYFRLRPFELGFLRGTRGRLPLLKRLAMMVDMEESRPTRREAVRSIVANVFGEAPRLTHVLICDISPLLQFNWSSLTIINIIFDDTPQEYPERILDALREALNLVELTVDARIDTRGSRSIHLPHLECLSVSEVKLLTILETPALRRLKIEFVDDAGIAVSFLRRSEIKLSTLVVGYTRAINITEILSSAPEVNDLALLHVQDVANVLEWLAGTGERELQINSLSVIWRESHTDSKLVEEECLSALYDMIARRESLDDARNPNPKEVVIQTPSEGQGAAANLKSVCRSRGIRFGFVEELSTLIWGIELPADVDESMW